jgi:hypothetical protein
VNSKFSSGLGVCAGVEFVAASGRIAAPLGDPEQSTGAEGIGTVSCSELSSLLVALPGSDRVELPGSGVSVGGSKI